MEGNVLDMGVSEHSLGVTTAAKAHLKSSAGWAQFIAIIFFILAAIMFLFGILGGVMMGSVGSEMPDMPMAGLGIGVISFLVYGLAGVLYLFIGLYQYRFAEKTKRAIRTNDSVDLEQALNNLRRYFKIQGIMMIIGISLVVLMFLFGMGAAMMSGY